MNVYFTVKHKNVYAYVNDGRYFESSINILQNQKINVARDGLSGTKCVGDVVFIYTEFGRWIQSLDPESKCLMVGYNIASKWDYIRTMIPPDCHRSFYCYAKDLLYEYRKVYKYYPLNLGIINTRIGTHLGIHLADEDTNKHVNFCKKLCTFELFKTQIGI